eukprot:gene2575-biopygen11080
MALRRYKKNPGGFEKSLASRKKNLGEPGFSWRLVKKWRAWVSGKEHSGAPAAATAAAMPPPPLPAAIAHAVEQGTRQRMRTTRMPNACWAW